MTAFMTALEFTSRGMSPDDRELARRLGIVLVFVFLFAAAFTRLESIYSHKFFDATGKAEWIWDRHDLARRNAIAFFAVADFTLPEHRYYTKLKIAADPQYTFWFNGKEIGGRETGETTALDEYDLTTLARTGPNRLVVALRSTDGVGGLLAAIDLAPETANYLVTGKQWKIFRQWNPVLPFHDPGGVAYSAPMLLGQPPLRRWNYLTTAPGVLVHETHETIQPIGSTTFATAIPATKISDGIAVTYQRAVSATAFDFSPSTSGRLRLVLKQSAPQSRVVSVRFANTREEMRMIEGNVTRYVFAPGETVALDPEIRHFRYAEVYEGLAGATVVR
jgi:hypothetical protein